MPAALLSDARLVGALEQGWISRRRHARGQGPNAAVLACLAEAGVRFADVDAFAFGSHVREAGPESIVSPDIYASRALGDLLLPPEAPGSSGRPVIHFVRHQFASTFYTAGCPTAAGIVIDGCGEYESVSLSLGGSAGVKRLPASGVPESLRIMYDAAGYYSGLGHDAAGKHGSGCVR